MDKADKADNSIFYKFKSFFTNKCNILKDKINNTIHNNIRDKIKNNKQNKIKNNTILITTTTTTTTMTTMTTTTMTTMTTTTMDSSINIYDNHTTSSDINNDFLINPERNPSIHTNDACVDIDILNYSKYEINIVSSTINDIINTILYNHNSLNKNNKNQYFNNNILDFYNKQLDYSHFKTLFDSNTYHEFCKIISSIINKNTSFLQDLYELKTYNDDLINADTRYGVFKTDNFVIKIDNSRDIFMPELEMMYLLGTGISSTHNIVTPYYIYLVPDNKNQTMNFSIQPYIKKSLPLYKWIRSYTSRQTPIEIYIDMCISISKSILHMHSYDIVHGDIKPDNILVDINTKKTYIIDFGLSGIHGLSYGTGGTKPFCCPETKNTNDRTYTYYWTKNNKYYDLWSIAFIFASILIFRNVYNNYSEYPINYFDKNKYITLLYLYRIPIKYKNIFILILSKKTNIDLSNFIKLLENISN
jgi:hypothetical protein